MTNDRVASKGWRSILHGTLLILTGFACGALLVLFVYDWYPKVITTTPTRDMTITRNVRRSHIRGKLLERVTIHNFTDNIYFTVKTSAGNYKSRLSLLLLTWLQTVNKRKVIKCHMICAYTVATAPAE